MVLEVAILNIIPGRSEAFLKAFAEAQEIIAGMPGYLSHRLKRCIEDANRFILLVEWQKLTDHTDGFRKSAEYQRWKALLHHFYNPFPVVEHYEDVQMI